MELEKKPHEICAQNELQNLSRYYTSSSSRGINRMLSKIYIEVKTHKFLFYLTLVQIALSVLFTSCAPRVCSDCKNTGVVKVSSKCSKCDGKGFTAVACSECAGTGRSKLYFTDCNKCNGKGSINIECKRCKGAKTVIIEQVCQKCHPPPPPVTSKSIIADAAELEALIYYCSSPERFKKKKNELNDKIDKFLISSNDWSKTIGNVDSKLATDDGFKAGSALLRIGMLSVSEDPKICAEVKEFLKGKITNSKK
jgi:hypothetical protein